MIESKSRAVSYDKGWDLALNRLNGAKFLETSSKTGFNVEEAFFEVLRSAR